MALPLPPAFRKKMNGDASASTSASDEEGENPLGEPSASDAPEMKGEKVNPLKQWAKSKLGG